MMYLRLGLQLCGFLYATGSASSGPAPGAADFSSPINSGLIVALFEDI